MIIEDVQILVHHQWLTLYQKVPFQSIWKSKYFGDQVKLSDTLDQSKFFLYLLFYIFNTDYNPPQLLLYIFQGTTIFFGEDLLNKETIWASKVPQQLDKPKPPIHSLAKAVYNYAFPLQGCY